MRPVFFQNPKEAPPCSLIPIYTHSLLLLGLPPPVPPPNSDRRPIYGRRRISRSAFVFFFSWAAKASRFVGFGGVLGWRGGGGGEGEGGREMVRLMAMQELGIDHEVLDGVINRLLEVHSARPGKQVQLSEEEIRQPCVVPREIFLQQPNLLELQAPIKICGDIHGQYTDF